MEEAHSREGRHVHIFQLPGIFFHFEKHELSIEGKSTLGQDGTRNGAAPDGLDGVDPKLYCSVNLFRGGWLTEDHYLADFHGRRSLILDRLHYKCQRAATFILTRTLDTL